MWLYRAVLKFWIQIPLSDGMWLGSANGSDTLFALHHKSLSAQASTINTCIFFLIYLFFILVPINWPYLVGEVVLSARIQFLLHMFFNGVHALRNY